MPSLDQSIDNLFKDEPISKETAQSLLEIMLANLEKAEKKTYTRFVAIIVLWVFGLAIGHGMLADASILGVKLKDISVILLGLPFVSAALYYGMVANICSAGNNLGCIRRIVKNHWPRVYESDLEEILLPPTFYSMEILLVRRTEGLVSRSITFWSVSVAILGLLVPIGCILHLAYLSITIAPVPVWALIVVLAASFILVLRGGSLFYQNTTI